MLVPIALFGIIRERNSWRPKTVRITSSIASNAFGISWSPNGNLIAAVSSKEIQVIQVAQQKVLFRFRISGIKMGEPCQLVFSPDGNRLAFATNAPNSIHLWDLQKGQLLYTFAGQMPICFDGTIVKGLELVDSDQGAYLTCWSALNGQKLNSVDFVKYSKCLPKDINWYYSYLNISPDGRYIATVLNLNIDPEGQRIIAENGGLQLFDAQTGQQKQRLLSPAIRAGGPVFSHDSRLLAVVTDENLKGQSKNGAEIIYVWDVASSFHLLAKVKCSSYGIFEISPDGTRLALANFRDNTIHLLDWKSGAIVRVMKSKSTANAINFSPDGSTLAIACEGGNLLLYRLK